MHIQDLSKQFNIHVPRDVIRVLDDISERNPYLRRGSDDANVAMGLWMWLQSKNKENDVAIVIDELKREAKEERGGGKLLRNLGIDL